MGETGKERERRGRKKRCEGNLNSIRKKRRETKMADMGEMRERYSSLLKKGRRGKKTFEREK